MILKEKNLKASNGVNLLKIVKEYIHDNPKIKKAIGVILILIGLAALFTPLTPGSWLALIGLQLLGFRILFLDKLRRSKEVGAPTKTSGLKFWNRK